VTVKQLYVAGAGLMGAGIAQTAITCGYDVTLREVDDGPLAKGMENIKTRLARQVQKGDLDGPARDAALGRLPPSPPFAYLRRIGAQLGGLTLPPRSVAFTQC